MSSQRRVFTCIAPNTVLENRGWWNRGTEALMNGPGRASRKVYTSRVCETEVTLRKQRSAHVCVYRVGATAPSRVVPQEFLLLSLQIVPYTGRYAETGVFYL